MENIADILSLNNCSLCVEIATFQGTKNTYAIQRSLETSWAETEILFKDSKWKVTHDIYKLSDKLDMLEGTVVLELQEGKLSNANISILMRFSLWSKENYVLMPAVAYNGNRFKTTNTTYPSFIENKDDMGINIPTTISNVPRLKSEAGPSGIHQKTGDLSTPSIGFYSPRSSKGFFLLTEQGTSLGDYGMSIDECEDGSSAIISLSIPAVREDYWCQDDCGYDFNKGDSVTLKFRLYFFECENITDLYNYFAQIRKDMVSPVELKHVLPFSSAWKIQEEKYNKENWEEKNEYYKIGTVDNIYQDWQIGWVGGAMSSYPLLFAGNNLSRERAFKTIDFTFRLGQAPSGFFYGIGYKGNFYGDNFRDISNKNWLLLRKNADAIYFLIKQFMLIEQLGSLPAIPNEWKEGLKRACNAFVRLWNKFGQWGQFIDLEKEEILIGGSSSCGIASAGLALCSKYFDEKEYLEIAEKSAEYYYLNYVLQGLTNGGPGEICQCPDSEAAFGLLESYVVLYEVTDNKKWLPMAENTAKQCATWCVSYNYSFPKASTFGNLDIHTLGAVWANVQNKHGAPGICTLSGASLFKLYRATGNKFYLELIRDIAHNLPQYLSRIDRPIKTVESELFAESHQDNTEDESPIETTYKELHSGWMNERVNLSDWESKKNVGEVFYGSCWAEVSLMLTYVEVPGLYVQTDTGLVYVIDNIDAVIIENNDTYIKLELKNTTGFDAIVRLLVESSKDMTLVLGENALLECEQLEIKANDTKVFNIYKK